MSKTATRVGAFVVGDRVKYNDAFLRSTGQFENGDTGPEWPCHWGPNARGTVAAIGVTTKLVRVQWDDGWGQNVMPQYLETFGLPTPEEMAERGYDHAAYMDADERQVEEVTELHPANWLTLAEVEDPRFNRWYHKLVGR